MRIIKGYNDLETYCKENNLEYILDEWNYEKNDALGIRPDNISAHNGAKVWFTCPKGHEYFSKISMRTKASRGQCPYCSGHLFKKGYNDFETWCKREGYEDLLKCWSKKNKIKPSEITPHKNINIWWKCEECGKEWKTNLCSIVDKRIAGYRCFCSSCATINGTEKRVQTIIDNGKTFYNWCIDNHREDVLEQWSPENKLSPKDVTAYSSEKIKWICKHGHEWECSVGERRVRNTLTGCPECVHRYYTSFSEKVVAYYIGRYFEIKENYRPDFLGRKEIDIFIPSLKVGIEYDGNAWHTDDERDTAKDILCKDNDIILVRIREYPLEELKTSICYVLSDKRTKDYYDDLPDAIILLLKSLGIENPDVDIERDYIAILELIHIERENNTLQVYCEENDLQWILDSWHPTLNGKLTPKGFTPFSNKEVWWICPDCGYEYKMQVFQKSNTKLGCPKCQPYKGSISLYDWCIENNAQYLLDEWNYDKNNELDINPKNISYSSNKRVWWIINGEEKFLMINGKTHYIPKKYRKRASK